MIKNNIGNNSKIIEHNPEDDYVYNPSKNKIFYLGYSHGDIVSDFNGCNLLFVTKMFQSNVELKELKTILEEYDFSQLDVFLASLVDGSFHDSEVKMGPEYNLFMRKYVYVISWSENLATLIDRPLHKAMGCPEVYTRVCKYLGPFLPEKFNLALIVDDETIASLARALANRLDGESILRQINWAIVDERTRSEWIENLPEIADMVKQIPVREAHGSFSKANVWTGWHEPMDWDQDYDPTPPIWR